MIEFDQSLLDALYSGAVDSAEFERALVLLSHMVDCLSAALISLDAQAPAASLVLATGAFGGPVARQYAEFAQHDPAPAAFARLARGTASTTSRILSPEQLNNGVFVNEFYRPNGFAETLGGHLHAEKAYFALIGLHRGNDRPPFDDDEIASIERLMPHVTRALRLRREFFGLQELNAGLQAALDNHPAAVLLLNPTGEPVFCQPGHPRASRPQ
jgi:hypothetical protein